MLNPANIRLNENVFKTSCRHLRFCLQKTSPRRLGQDQYVRLGHTSSRRLTKRSSKRLEDVFKTSSRHFQDVSSISTVLVKTSSRSIQRVSETYSKDGYL